MANYNRIVMIGNLTRDPEFRTIPSGQAVCRLGLASNRQFKNRQTGAMIQEVCYVDIDVWGNQAESCRQYLQKGRAILVEGRLKLDTWQDNNGQNRSKHSIVADRIVFLSQGLAAEQAEGASVSAAPKEPENELEKGLLDQIDQIKERAAKKESSTSAGVSAGGQDERDETVKAAKVDAAEPAKKKKTAKKAKDAEKDADAVGGVEFKDEPPFEDDLPF